MTEPTVPRENSTSDLRRLIVQLVAARWWLLASVIASTGLFVTAAYTIRPVFRATAVLIPASGERSSLSGAMNSALGQLGGLAVLAGVGGNTSDALTEEALAVLRSRQFSERFIDDNQLMPALFPTHWDSAKRQWKAGEASPTPARAYKYFSRIRTVTQDKKTGLLSVQIDWGDREQAADWANDLARRINSEMRARAISSVDASIAFLEKELRSALAVETRDAINRLIEAQVKQRMLANVTEEYAFRVVDKAMPPDADDPIRPQRFLLFVLGPLVGLLIGIVAVLIFNLVVIREPVAPK